MGKRRAKPHRLPGDRPSLRPVTGAQVFVRASDLADLRRRNGRHIFVYLGSAEHVEDDEVLCQLELREVAG